MQCRRKSKINKANNTHRTTLKNTKKTGDKGEEIATNYLINLGYYILKKNFRSGKSEIDIIAKTKDFVVFIEVKTRTKHQNTMPREIISISQQKRIISAAHEYIIQNDIDEEARFDLITIKLDKNNTVDHIKDAFQATI